MSDFDSQFDDQFEDENQEDDFEEEFDDEADDFEEGFEDDYDDDGFEDQDDQGYDDSDDDDYDKPVEEGDVVELEVDDLGSKGDGIARIDGFVVFVPGGEVGETYEVEITSVGRKFGFSEIKE